jgi:hypothetical protein
MLNWLQRNVDQLLAANDITIVFFMTLMGSIIVRYIFHTKFSGLTDIKIMLGGIATLCYGLVIHRAYWGMKRIARIFELNHLTNWIETNAYWALIPGLTIVIGIMFVISPALCQYLVHTNRISCKNCFWKPCFLIVFLFTLAFYWFVFFKIHEYHYSLRGNFHETIMINNINFQNQDFENELQRSQWKPLIKNSVIDDIPL